jgi:hypothetical protein
MPRREHILLNVRTALREGKRASSTSIQSRVGSIGKRCNKTMLTRDAARGHLRGKHESHPRRGCKRLRNK